MHEHPDRVSAEINLDSFLALNNSDCETLLADEDSARRLLEQLRHDAYRGPWRDERHEDWGERYGLLGVRVRRQGERGWDLGHRPESSADCACPGASEGGKFL